MNWTGSSSGALVLPRSRGWVTRMVLLMSHLDVYVKAGHANCMRSLVQIRYHYSRLIPQCETGS